MKRTFRILLVFYGVVILLIASCRKSTSVVSNISTVSTTTVDYTQLNSLFNGLQPYAQNIKVNAGTYQTVRAAGGTVLRFYPHSFRDKIGNFITNGVVNIQITEMYNPGAMLANRSSETSNGKLLNCGGQVNIKATINGMDVFANKYGIEFLASKPSTEPFNLFYGVKGADSVVNWGLSSAPTGTSAYGTTIDSFLIVSVDTNGHTLDTMVVRTNYNKFDSCTSFDWISCSSFFASGGAVTDIYATPTDTLFNNSNTTVFLIFPDINSIAPVNHYNASSRTFSLNSGYEVPVGVKVHLVAIANVSGTYYYFQQKNVNITNGIQFSPMLTRSTLNQIIASIMTL